MSERMRLALCGIVAVLSARAVFAFDPPSDKAGPLTARIEGLKEITRAGGPLPVRVVVENSGKLPLNGTVALRVIDRWTAQPATAVPFAVGANQTVTKDFTVTADPGSYDADYPIHAYVQFSHEGREWTAHPVLVVPIHVERHAPGQAVPPWRPVPIGSEGRTALWNVSAFRAVIQVSGQPPRTLPTGWRGRDEPTYATIDVRSQEIGQERREAVAIHPPWRDGRVGTAFVEFPLVLPDKGPIRLRFENAVAPDGKGDGVTFRVRVTPLDAPEGTLGDVVYERHSAAKRWGSAGEADLGRYAGRAIRLQLESHPGPRNDTSFDQSFWAVPTLVTGNPAPPRAFPPLANTGSESLGNIRFGDKTAEVRVWPGRRGLLDAAVGFVSGAGSLYFHGVEVRVLGQRIDDESAMLRLMNVEAAREGGVYRVRHHFEGPEGAFDLVGRLEVVSGALRVRFALENTPPVRPWKAVVLEDVALGPWSRTARQVYAGHGNVVRGPSAYSLDFDGHRLSTSFVGFDFNGGPAVVQGVDAPPTRLEVNPGEKRYSLHAAPGLTITLIPSSNVFEGVKVWRTLNGLKPSRGVEKAAGRFVFDLWGGRYQDAATALRRSFRYGLGDSLVVWHDWQRWGYDYRLPDVFPPNPKWGTQEELKDLVAACKASNTLFALHDNYIDFYPDAEGFSYDENIAFDANGRPERAWIHEARGAQSYRYRADRVEPFLVRNLGLIRPALVPTAYFLDVWSSIRPYEYWTADGRFFDRVATRDTWGKLFARIRDELGADAPQLSESGHDQLIGWLDGAQTNHLRVGRPVAGHPQGSTLWDWRCDDAERTPWFDAAHHDRFVLHGAGYPGRYEAGLGSGLHGIYSDDYIATEVLTGHPAMTSDAFGHDVVRKHWLVNGLMRALALKRIEAVAYVNDDLHRQHVRWSGGGEVWVNRGETDWEVAGRVLPSYGFLARVPTAKGPVEASISRRGGLIVEESRSPEQVYANARGFDGPIRIRPSVSDVRLVGAKAFTLAVRWQADDAIPEGLQPFLHFCDARGEIAFQAAQEPGAGRDRATKVVRAVANGNLPVSAAPGAAFELYAGLFDPKTGKRATLFGPDDGQSRVRLGTLHIDGRGGSVTGLTWTPVKPAADPLLARLNPQRKAVDFGALVTAGGVRLTREGRAIVLTPLPSDAPNELSVTLHTKVLPWNAGMPNRVEAVAEDGRVLAGEQARRSGDDVAITCRPGVFRYRLIAD
ncbi:MAG: DUF5696 domain-containing protein [Isosphaeraceae bacterium]|nr:DUF5696 domain-containing protein [Isosphaeraceae bacterium]